MLEQLFRRLSSRKSRFDATRRLGCESLEDRRVLATFVVTSSADSGMGTLRQAIDDANSSAGNDRIEFEMSMDGRTIALTSSGFGINENLVIDASNLNLLTVDAMPLDTNPGSSDGRGERVFDVIDGHFEIQGLTIRGADVLGSGGGIRTTGSLTVRDSHFDGNLAFDRGSAISVDAADDNTIVQIIDSTFTDNGKLKWGFGDGASGGAISVEFPSSGTGNVFALQGSTFNGNGHSFETGPSMTGGAAFLYGGRTFNLVGNHFDDNHAIKDDNGGGNGGGIFLDPYTTGSTTMIDNTITNNTASYGGGLWLYSVNTAAITDSIISGNSAIEAGGGIYFYGDDGSLSIDRSAVVGNSASMGGGVVGIGNEGVLSVFNSTISGNSAVSGAGVLVRDDVSGIFLGATIASNSASLSGGGLFVSTDANVAAENTILADNVAGLNDNDLVGNITASHSLIESKNVASVITGSDNLEATDPMLLPLGDNGGSTMTHALADGSPAIDSGMDGANFGAFDQRGTPFSRTIDGDRDGTATIDMGAFEFQPLPNVEPVADAGDDATIILGMTFELDGTGSMDDDNGPDPLSFDWNIVDSPGLASLSASTTSMPVFEPTVAGMYTIELTVFDGEAMATDTVVIEVIENAQPVADGSLSELRAEIGSPLTLDGSNSVDPDMDSLTFAWSIEEQPVGSNATILVPSIETTSLFMDAPGRYVVSLVVSDGALESDPAFVEVFAFDPLNNSAPMAFAESDDLDIFEGESTLLTAESSYDADGDPLSYDWAIISAPSGGDGAFDAANAASTNFTATVAGPYEVQVIVDDGTLFSDPAMLTILVSENVAPTADVSLSENMGETGIPITLDGTLSMDPEGADLTYEWTIVAQPAGSNPMIEDSTVAATSLIADLPGTYEIQLVVNDGSQPSAPVTLMIDVAELNPPTANVSLSENSGSINMPIELDGSASTGATSYQWSIVLQPDGANPVIADDTAAITTWTTDVPGTYRVELVVSESGESSPPVRFLTEVSANAVPIANVSLSNNAGMVNMDVVLNGSRSSDPGGGSLTYAWSVIDMPAGSNAAINNESSAVTTFNADMAGAYRVRLIVNNGTDDSLPVTFVITIAAPIGFEVDSFDSSEADDEKRKDLPSATDWYFGIY